MEISNRVISSALYQAQANGLQFMVGVLTAIGHAELAQEIISASIEIDAAVAARDEKYPVPDTGDFWADVVATPPSSDTPEGQRLFAAYQRHSDLMARAEALRESLGC